MRWGGERLVAAFKTVSWKAGLQLPSFATMGTAFSVPDLRVYANEVTERVHVRCTPAPASCLLTRGESPRSHCLRFASGIVKSTGVRTWPKSLIGALGRTIDLIPCVILPRGRFQIFELGPDLLMKDLGIVTTVSARSDGISMTRCRFFFSSSRMRRAQALKYGSPRKL